MDSGDPQPRAEGAIRHAAPGPRSEIVEGVQRGVLIGLAVAVLILPPMGLGSVGASAHRPPPQVQQQAVRFADFGDASASPDAQFIAHWVVDSRNNQNLPFVIVDKKDARIHVFEPGGRLRGSSPVLLGSRAGDDAVPGIGGKAIADVQLEERTTHAGRFLAEPGRNAHGEDVVWVDYDAAVSMHRVRVVDPAERRLERLASPTPDDNRISYGCINVPVAFFEQVLRPSFHQTYGVVYVLPESSPVGAVFPAYDVRARSLSAVAQR